MTKLRAIVDKAAAEVGKEHKQSMWRRQHPARDRTAWAEIAYLLWQSNEYSTKNNCIRVFAIIIS